MLGARLPVPSASTCRTRPAASRFGGQYDLIESYGPQAAQTLSHSYYFLFPGQRHGQIFGHYDPNTPSCGIQIMAEFFADPTRSPDASCIDALPATHFL